MRTYLGVGLTVLLSSIAFAKLRAHPTITHGTTSLVIKNSMRILALVPIPGPLPLLIVNFRILESAFCQRSFGSRRSEPGSECSDHTQKRVQ